MDSAALLPPSIRDERMLALAALLDRYDALDFGLLRNLWNPGDCNAAALPALARTMGVLDEAWALAVDEAQQRDLLRLGLVLNRHRGTPWALVQALGTVGWPLAVIDEHPPAATHEGTAWHDGNILYGGEGLWATFRVVLDVPPDKGLLASDVMTLRKAVSAWSPVFTKCSDLVMSVAPEWVYTEAWQGQPGRWLEVGGERFEVRTGDPYTPYMATVRVDAASLLGQDLQVFNLYDDAENLIATASRGVPLVKSDFTLRFIWSIQWLP